MKRRSLISTLLVVVMTIFIWPPLVAEESVNCDKALTKCLLNYPSFENTGTFWDINLSLWVAKCDVGYNFCKRYL